MLLNAREVINKNSTEKLILLSIEDITERKRAQEILDKKWGFRLELAPEDIARIREYNVHLYAFQGYSTKLWKTYNDDTLNLRKAYPRRQITRSLFYHGKIGIHLIGSANNRRRFYIDGFKIAQAFKTRF